MLASLHGGFVWEVPAPPSRAKDPGAGPEGVLLVWAEPARPEGEAASAPARGAPTPPRGPRGGRRTDPTPFGIPGQALASTLADVVPGLAADRLAAVRASAWLPTATAAPGLPLPSDPALGEAEPRGEAALRPWPLHGIALGAAEALRLLTRCAGNESLAGDLLVGPDLRFWVEALRLAADVAARQMFLPAVERDAAGQARAVWEPLLAGRTGQRAEHLAAAMPAACRAVGGGAAPAEAPPDTPALTVLRHFVRFVVDHLARGVATPVADPGVAAWDSVHDQWVHALGAPGGRLVGKQADLAALEAQAREWAAPLRAAGDPSFRLCFRLEEPAGEDGAGDGDDVPEADVEPASDGAWRVHYLLQAVDDPSLLIPADRVWKPSERAGPAAPRPVLLAALGRAAALCLEVEASLRGPDPTGFDLDTAGAHAFLSETAWLLEDAGFGVLLPSWWSRGGPRARLAARAHARAPAAGVAGLGLDAVVAFDWQVALGEHVLTREELEALAALKSPLVRIRGRWVQVSAEEILAGLALLEGRGPLRGTVRDALRFDAGAGAAGLPIAEVQGEGWVGDLLGRLRDPDTAAGAAFAELDPPPGLRAHLRPYQVRGYSWLSYLAERGLGACLADDMGLGKTLQTLSLIARDRALGAAEPVLLVCPTSVLGNWVKEAERFTPGLAVLAHHGPDRLRGADFAAAARRHALVATTYALLPRDLETLRGVPWSGLVLDEAQNVKNPEARQSAAARAVAAGYRVALTGTPVENSVGDLWSIMEFLNPGLLGSQADFRQRFFMPIQVSADAEAIAQLRRLTGPFVLRRVKTDPAVAPDLPPKTETKVHCTLTREQGSLYAAVLKDVQERLEDAEGIARRGLILATLSKLKQVCNHPAHFLGDHSPIPGRSGKIARLDEMLEEVLAAGQRALLFTQFTEMGHLLQQHLREALRREVLFLHGGVPRTARERMVERFQAAGGGPPVFVLSLKAGGTGLNLTAASHVFHFDRWWNPAVENQATDRAFRIGQSHPVQVHKFVCTGTLEERIDALIEGKRELAENVVGSGEAWLTELSTAELRDILALRPEAVEE